MAARPSGTEPKIKFYLFTAAEPCSAADLPAIKETLRRRLDAMEADLAGPRRRMIGPAAKTVNRGRFEGICG